MASGSCLNPNLSQTNVLIILRARIRMHLELTFVRLGSISNKAVKDRLKLFTMESTV